MACHAHGAGIRAFVWLLVHRFPGDPARDGGEIDGGGAAHAFGRGCAENVVAVSGDSARHDRDLPNKLDGSLNYDLVIPLMLRHYFPSGILGLGLTALMASFMSGMAGNVTAFNTVWTYDIYQAYLKRGASDAHYLWMGRAATVGGILLSVAAAYAATAFNNIMDFLQLVFAFVNAPLFATFLLGMFWKRTTGHGAFMGLLAGTTAAALHQGLTLPAAAMVGIKGGWLGPLLHRYPSEIGRASCR